jgi:hypothetical protein
VPYLYACLFKERIEPPRQFRQMMTRHLGIEMVFQVISQFEKDRWDNPPTQGMRLG